MYRLIFIVFIICACSLEAKAQLNVPYELSNDSLYKFGQDYTEVGLKDFDLLEMPPKFCLKINEIKYFFNTLSHKGDRYYLTKELSDSGEELHDNRGLLIFSKGLIIYIGFKLGGTSVSDSAYPEVGMLRKGNFDKVKSIMLLGSDLKTKYVIYYEKGKALFVDKVLYNNDGSFHAIKAGASAQIRELDLKYNMYNALNDLQDHVMPMQGISLRISIIHTCLIFGCFRGYMKIR